MSKEMNVTTILEELSSLRFFEGEEKEFWDLYLENIAALSKSPLALLLSLENDELKVENEYSEDNISTELKEQIISQSGEVSLRSLKNIYAYEKFKDGSKQLLNNFIVSIAQESFDEDKQYILVLLIENHNKIEFSNIIIRSALCRDIPLNFQIFQDQSTELEQNSFLAPQTEQADIKEESSSGEYFENILLLLNNVIYEKEFQLAAMKLVDDFANRFNCNKVSLGWEDKDYIKPIAINQVEHFQRSSKSIKALEALFEESYEQDEEIYYPLDEDSILVTHSHKIYSAENKLTALYTFPIRVDDRVVGVISFEMNDSTLSSKELEVIRLTLNYISPTLYRIYLDDQNIFQKTFRYIKDGSREVLGPKNSLKKLLVLTFTILIAWIVFGKMEYKVEAVSNLQTDNILYMSAPFDGIVKDMVVDEGDMVEKGEKLVSFDKEELLLKKLEINADIIKYNTEIEKARANRALADMKISQAKKEQAGTSLKKIDYYINKAELKAPFDGIIIEGDKEKLLGSPFAKGDKILQIANPTELYIKIKVLEEYIDEIKVGQSATLNLLSRPEISFDVKIDKIIPMANVDDVNGNVFNIKVVFDSEVKEWMRPGMSGIVKIKIEDRSVLWILTHKISDYLHMNVWW